MVTLAQKKYGTNRFCIDYRKLNQITKFDAEPLPDMDQLFTKLSGKLNFSKIDLAKGFWQIPMKLEDKEKTAFTTPQGQFQWTTMPFGQKNAGAIFSRIMRKLLQPLPHESVSNFMDDLLIVTETWEEHIHVLTQLFQRLEQCDLKAKPSKSQLGCKSLSFLGHVVSRGILMPEEDKVLKLKNTLPPKTKKELRAFLGLSNYYRRFIPNFANIALPLTDKTRKGNPEMIEWDSVCQEAFENLK